MDYAVGKVIMRWVRILLYVVAALSLIAAAAAAWFEWTGRRALAEAMSAGAPKTCGGGAQLVLPDGRRLGYRDAGPRGGDAALYFHGALGSRFEWPVRLDRLPLRVIGVDRPGYGCSDPNPRASVFAFADDARRLADHLGLPRVRVIAWSMGTAYGMGFAARYPDRVTRLDLIGPVAPQSLGGDRRSDDPRVTLFTLVARNLPGAGFGMIANSARERDRDPAAFEDRLAAPLSEVDRRVTAEPEARARLLRVHEEGFRQRGPGIYADTRLFDQDWGFDLARLRVPAAIWQGTDDNLTPYRYNRVVAEAIPGAQLRLFEGEGHFLLYRHEDEILAAR